MMSQLRKGLILLSNTQVTFTFYSLCFNENIRRGLDDSGSGVECIIVMCQVHPPQCPMRPNNPPLIQPSVRNYLFTRAFLPQQSFKDIFFHLVFTSDAVQLWQVLDKVGYTLFNLHPILLPCSVKTAFFLQRRFVFCFKLSWTVTTLDQVPKV